MNPVLLMAVVMVVSFVVGAVIVSRRPAKRLTPRANQRQLRFSFYCTLGALLLLLVMAVFMGGQLPWFLCAFLGVSVAATGWHAFRRPSAKEIYRNYVNDPEHCGQCEYNLTGNVSGVCPECGWKIPPLPARIEKPDWMFWWKGWDVEYLDNWRRTLMTLILMTVLFIATAAIFAWFFPGVLVLIPAIMSIHFVLNAVRAAAYGRRHREDDAGKGQE